MTGIDPLSALLPWSWTPMEVAVGAWSWLLCCTLLGLGAGLVAARAASKHDLQSTFWAWVLYASPPIFFISYVALLASVFSPLGWWPLATTAALYGWFSCRGQPAFTGERRWDWFCSRTWIWDSVSRYFFTRVVGHNGLSSEQAYIFGFHPHGLYPGTVIWAPLTTMWRRHFANSTPRRIVPLGASILFYWPFLRDVFFWCGLRDVSRKSIHHTLQGPDSIGLIPGGMREMFHSRARSPRTVIVTKHKGFCREALISGRALVPVYVFGETSVMENFYLPDLQAWFKSIVGFGYPHYPHGRWYLPFPHSVPLTIAIGNPIAVETCPQPTPQQIDTLHDTYYRELRRIFEAHKGDHPGTEQELVFDH